MLIPDTNVIGTEVRYAPTGGASTAAGMVLLANYIQGITSDVAIVGTPNTTPYGSLQEALGSISIKTSIPPIHQLIVTQASLSFPIDIADTGIAEASFDLSNPFTASINLQDLVANATYDTFYLGQINQQPLNPEISAPGHKNITSRKVPFELTDDPKFLINFLIAVAKANGVDLGILLPEFEYVLSEVSTATSVTSKVNTGKETCTPTGTTKLVQNIILAAVKNLKTDLGIQSVVALDDFVTPLNFAQNGVPTVLDDSVLYLTGLLGRTIVSHIVDQAELTFSGGNVTDITDNGFKVALTGSLLNAGPFDALIEVRLASLAAASAPLLTHFSTVPRRCRRPLRRQQDRQHRPSADLLGRRFGRSRLQDDRNPHDHRPGRFHQLRELPPQQPEVSLSASPEVVFAAADTPCPVFAASPGSSRPPRCRSTLCRRSSRTLPSPRTSPSKRSTSCRVVRLAVRSSSRFLL